jgi:hypothetical protein
MDALEIRSFTWALSLPFLYWEGLKEFCEGQCLSHFKTVSPPQRDPNIDSHRHRFTRDFETQMKKEAAKL